MLRIKRHEPESLYSWHRNSHAWSSIVPPVGPTMEPACASWEVCTGKGHGSVQTSGKIKPKEIIGETGFNPQADSMTKSEHEPFHAHMDILMEGGKTWKRCV